MTQAPPLIRNVSDTARWVAFYRAMESERPDAIFHDPYARRLAGERGEAIVQAMPRGRAMAWPMIVRTALLDEFILRAVERDGIESVLNLAAGLDARPWRLALPPSLRWVDVDLPELLDYKLATLQGEHPRCQYEGVTLDLAEATGRRELFHRIGNQGLKVLVITEGLLVYLEPGAVAELAQDLAAERSFRFWLMDLASPGLLKMLERTWAPALRAGNAPMRFAPAESTAYFAPFGWREQEYRSLFDESIRLHRGMPMARFWRFVGRLAPRRKREEWKRFSGVALLERGTP